MALPPKSDDDMPSNARADSDAADKKTKVKFAKASADFEDKAGKRPDFTR